MRVNPGYSSMVTREAIIAAARSWLGTPYHHQASLKGVGSDCLGLIRGIWRELYGPEPEAMPPYTRDWGITLEDLSEVLSVQRIKPKV